MEIPKEVKKVIKKLKKSGYEGYNKRTQRLGYYK